MKKMVLSGLLSSVMFFALATASDISAQNSIAILSAITSKIESGDMAEIRFDFSILDEKGEEAFFDTGVFEAQDSLYRVRTSVYAIYCNAYKKWIHDIPAGEITILSYERSLTDVTENPLMIFTSIDGNFSYSSKPKEYNNGKGWIIALKPIDKKFPYDSIEIAIDKQSGLPVAVRCITKDKRVYIVTILEFNLKPAQSVDYFMLNVHDHPHAYVTDMTE